MQGNIQQVPHWGNEVDDEWTRRDPEERIREDQITRRREDQVGTRKNQTSWREETRRQRKTRD